MYSESTYRIFLTQYFQVRFNLVKHLRLHNKPRSVNGVENIPFLTPVNPPPIVEQCLETNYSKMMTATLPAALDEEEFRLDRLSLSRKKVYK